MEHRKYKLASDEEEEEEEVSLHSHSQHLNNTTTANNNNDAADPTLSLISNGSNGNGKENGSIISCSSTDSETPGGEETLFGSPHKHRGDGVGDGDGEGHNQNSVYFDQLKGLWKCRHCNWTYCGGTPWTDPVQNHKDHCSHLLINDGNFNQQDNGSIFEAKGADSIHGVSDMNCCGVACSASELSPRDAEVHIGNSEIHKSLIKDVSLQSGKNLISEWFSVSGIMPLEDTVEGHDFISKPSNIETREIEDFGLIDETEQKISELDIEKVLEKQNTHDLYCPNCNSCITRRVILRRRKRKARKARRKPKHDKFDTILSSELDANSTCSASYPGHDAANMCSNDSPTPAAVDDNYVREPEVFRCLSCFSFFIPSGNGFKLSRLSSIENGNVQDSHKVSTANTDWFFSIFSKRKITTERVTSTEQDNAAVDHSQVHGVNQGPSSCISNNVSSLNRSDHSAMPNADTTTVNTGEYTEVSYSKPHQSEMESLDTSKIKLLLVEKSPEGLDLKSNPTTGNQQPADRSPLLPSADRPLDKSSPNTGLVDDMRTASSVTGKEIASPSIAHEYTGNALTSAREISGEPADKSVGSSMSHATADTVHHLRMPCSSDNMQHQRENGPSVRSFSDTSVHIGEPAANASLRPLQDGGNSLEYTTSKSLISGQLKTQKNENLNMAIGNEKPLQNGQALSTQATSSPTQVYLGGFVSDSTGKHHEAIIVALNSLSQGNPRPWKEGLNIEEKTSNDVNNQNIGHDIIVLVEKEPPKHEDSKIARVNDSVEPSSLPESTNQTFMGEQRGAVASEGRQLEILKSIVYGGLTESIASLGLVSSSAAAGAATLNIIALGLANLIGGLFLIGHNLMDLKNDAPGGVSSQLDEQEDRYHKTLGLRENFPLHATVSILSFLIFGLLSPVIYGFSFQKSDGRYLKLLAAGGASLVCITLLALGKAHIQRKQHKPYLSTVFYFVSIGLMASGASYIAGDLIGKLLQKTSQSESSLNFAYTLPFPKLKQMEPAWTSH